MVKAHGVADLCRCVFDDFVYNTIRCSGKLVIIKDAGGGELALRCYGAMVSMPSDGRFAIQAVEFKWPPSHSVVARCLR